MCGQGFPAPHHGRFSQIRLLFLIFALSGLAAFSVAAGPDQVQRQRLAQARVPFVENCGQWDGNLAFAARTGFGAVLVTPEGQLVYAIGNRASAGGALTETAISGYPVPRPGPTAVTRVSFFYGDDPARWLTRLPSYEEIGLGEVWRGVSVRLRARGSNVEKVFTIRPGASADRIRMKVDGATMLRVDTDGALVASTEGDEVRFTPPLAYQEVEGTRRPVAAAYVLRGSTYGFRLGTYDHALPIVIDPLLQSTYIGTTSYDVGSGLAIDPTSGDIFVAGGSLMTSGGPIPGTAGGAQPGPSGGYDGFIVRFDPTLTTIIQATYLGGAGDDAIYDIAIHPTSGEVLVTGTTTSTNFPGTAGGAQPVPGSRNDGFVARLDQTLTTLIQATYLGGSSDDYAYGIAIQPASDEILVAGYSFPGSVDFPGMAGGAQQAPGGFGDGFVARLDSTLTTLLQATYLGGSGTDVAWSLTTHPTSGEVLVAGSTDSTDFPGTAGGAQPAPGGFTDGFVARLNPTLTAVLQATYLGGSGTEVAWSLAVHPTSGEILVAGSTDSLDFPGTAGGAQPAYGGGDLFGGDAFVARLDPTLTTLIQATYLGGSGAEPDFGRLGITIHPSSGEVLVAGDTDSPDFPGTAGGAQPTLAGTSDAFIARLDTALTTLLQATYLGGSGPPLDSPSYGADWVTRIAVHPTSGEILVAGGTNSADFPGTAGGAQPVWGGTVDGRLYTDAFVARLTPDLGGTPATLTVSIDIKPGSATNPINPKSKGKIPVAILTTDTFDATTVDPTTVRFGATGTEAAPTQFAAEDVNGDGRPDLLLHFDTQKTGIQCGEVSASLTGMTLDGQAIQGFDAIVTVGCR